MNGTALILTNFLRATRQAHAAAALPASAKAVVPAPSAKVAPARKTKAAKAPTYDVRTPASHSTPAIPSVEKPSDPAGDAWAKAIREVNAGLPGCTPEHAEHQADRSAALFEEVERWRQEEGR